MRGRARNPCANAMLFSTFKERLQPIFLRKALPKSPTTRVGRSRLVLIYRVDRPNIIRGLHPHIHVDDTAIAVRTALPDQTVC